MKKCIHCTEIKSFDNFYKDKNCKDNYGVKCKSCHKKDYRKNKKEILDKAKKRYNENKERLMAYDNAYQNKNKEKLKQYRKKYKKQNSERYNFINSLRRSNKLKATPSWLSEFDLNYIQHIYIQAKELEKIDGNKRHVDHIIPLKGKQVCGLHVPWNLQILTAKENLTKNNRY